MPENRGHMPPMQPSIEILSGFGTFTRVITRGKRYEKQPIKAFVSSSLSLKTSLHVGYTVTKKIRTAAHRNRLKRLMREAFLAKKTDFIRQLNSGTLVEIVFMYHGNTEIAPTMVRFSSIAQALSALCSMIFAE
jgi:ribonuclease P protein component